MSFSEEAHAKVVSFVIQPAALKYKSLILSFYGDLIKSNEFGYPQKLTVKFMKN